MWPSEQNQVRGIEHNSLMRKSIPHYPYSQLSYVPRQTRSVALEQASSGDAMARGYRPSNTGSDQMKAVHILVVDDCPVQRLVSCTLLSQWGIHPELACDGLEAVLLVGAQTFDLILMDLHMPVMDGLTATARIRVIEHQQQRSKPVPVIAYTSEPIAGNLSAWSQSGITAALAKPCTQAEMGECLEHWCGIDLDMTQH